MLKYKRTAAILMSILIGASAAAAPISVFADEEETASVSEEAETADIDEEPADNTPAISGLKTSGDFSYSMTYDNTICIENCTSTEANLVVPDTIDGIQVTEIGKTAFGTDPYNNPFETISLPASINYISADNPFLYCTSLTEITVDASNSDYVSEDGILFSKDKTKLVCYPQKKSGKTYAIPEGVTEIGSAGVYNTELEKITFPSTLETIGTFSVGDNAGLISADLSKTALTSIGSYAFSGCAELSEVLLPDTLNEIGGAAFAMCGALTEITLPESLYAIRQYAFYDTGLTEITIPASVESIAYCAFGYYTDEETGYETANEKFLIIGEYGSAAQTYATDSDKDYGYSNNFTFLTVEQYEEQKELLSLERITSGDYEYAIVDGKAVVMVCYSSASSISIPSEFDGYTVSAIYPAAFSTCTASEIILPDTIETIREMAFYNCQYLQKIVLPQSVTTVGDSAFDGCTMLVSVDLGNAREIESGIFYNCTSLKSVTISGECTSIADDAFMYCSALEEINVTDGSGAYSSENGILYNKDKTTLIAYPSAKSDVKFTVPSSVTLIARSAFLGSIYLEEADLSSVTVISEYAFESCTALKKVKLSKNLTSLGTDAFYGCSSLKSLRFYDKLDYLGEYAFGFCYNPYADTENDEAYEVAVEGFKVYAEKDTLAYNYAKDMGLEVVSGTIEMFGSNVDAAFPWIIGGGGAAIIAALIGILAGKGIKKKKAEKDKEKQREKNAEKKKKKSDDDNDAEDK